MRWYHRRQRDRGEGVRHLLMIGGGAIAAKYLLALQHNPYSGFQVDGYLAGQETRRWPAGIWAATTGWTSAWTTP